ncbi:hypothetical protein CQS04_07500 [Chryseomicrobium excrementi]|uniref:Adenylyl-sulfate kinase n=1 Tax=Chryseomicrobium excrementi TaxID=2041346 RepID=A0A2M9F0K7_9BACL|nr:hypothetical protein [Chryseomicrobium excrementi]PJK16992.1 hypothetical protein CQS04_07500 [Chryseomicrobium excrementi]
MASKLILIEGLPGSGKSTTASLVEEVLQLQKTEVRVFLEGNALHPADFEGVAYIDHDLFDKFVETLGVAKEAVFLNCEERDDHVLVPYKALQEIHHIALADEWVQLFQKSDVYELPLDLHQQLVKEKWQQFVQFALKENKTFVFECAFIQNPITVMMIKYDRPNEEILSYIKELEAIVAELDPILLYVEQENFELSFGKAVEERSIEWRDFFIWYYTSQGVGKRVKAEGIEGTIEVLRRRQIVEREVYNQLSIGKVRLDNSEFEREVMKQKLEKAIQCKGVE